MVHLQESGFDVTVHETPDLESVKAEHGIGEEFAACHTALVDGYVVEGHVPAEDIKRMLEERPDVIGLVVPGMPIGSPGMESNDRPADHYDVLALDKDGNTSVFSKH